MKITEVFGREVLDSRGNPTVEVEITLEDATMARAIVPSGASTGEKEACELRDGNPRRYGGKGVLTAVGHVNSEIGRRLSNMDAYDQKAVDQAVIELDGTPNKSKLGANAILGTSMAVVRAAAASKKRPLYDYLSDGQATLLPVPCLNIINGGKHADNNVDFQEFMIAPHNASSFRESIRMGIETFHALKGILVKKGYSTGVGDEGGFAPSLKSNVEAVELILEAINKAGFKPGVDISICLDPAASEMWDEGKYIYFKSDKSSVTPDRLVRLWCDWVRQYPIILIEDGMAENDWDGWKMLTEELGSQIELVGDDIFCTNPSILKRGIDAGIANSILIKLNQIGTVTETLDTIQLAREHDYNCFVSHRSGETDDSFISDLTVAVGAGHLKTGSGCRGERIAKFNQLLRIEDQLGSRAQFAGKKTFKHAG